MSFSKLFAAFSGFGASGSARNVFFLHCNEVRYIHYNGLAVVNTVF